MSSLTPSVLPVDSTPPFVVWVIIIRGGNKRRGTEEKIIGLSLLLILIWLCLSLQFDFVFENKTKNGKTNTNTSAFIFCLYSKCKTLNLLKGTDWQSHKPLV